MRARFERKRYPMLRVWGEDQGEIAYVTFRLHGLELTVETPSDWDEHRRVWFHIGLGFAIIAFSFRWHGKVVPDLGQCSGPRYGFKFYADQLWIYFGKDTGGWTKARRYRTINMPWAWTHVRHSYLWPEGYTHTWQAAITDKPPEVTVRKFAYTYRLCSGEVQHRVATVNGEEREWRLYYAPWLPWPHMRQRAINVQFSDEVGERSGSWKGGCTGCGYEWRKGETLESALRRMERERKF